MWFYVEKMTEARMLPTDGEGLGDLLEWTVGMLAVLPFHMKTTVRAWYMSVCQTVANGRTPFDNYPRALKDALLSSLNEKNMEPEIQQVCTELLSSGAGDAIEKLLMPAPSCGMDPATAGCRRGSSAFQTSSSAGRSSASAGR